MLHKAHKQRAFPLVPPPADRSSEPNARGPKKTAQATRYDADQCAAVPVAPAPVPCPDPATHEQGVEANPGPSRLSC
eukprot:5260834-Amphidinium_carterae.1